MHPCYPWMKLEDKISQIQKDKYCVNPRHELLRPVKFVQTEREQSCQGLGGVVGSDS